MAPTKTITIPRLGLSSALVLAELMVRVSISTGILLSEATCWCDSTVVLSLIRSDSAQWKAYVGNHVTQIIDTVSFEHWGHVSSTKNPADPLSSGVTTDTLNELHL